MIMPLRFTGLNSYKKKKISRSSVKKSKAADENEVRRKLIVQWSIQVKTEKDYLNLGEITLSSWTIYDGS